jgi:hypothetical protein
MNNRSMVCFRIFDVFRAKHPWDNWQSYLYAHTLRLWLYANPRVLAPHAGQPLLPRKSY